MTKKTIIVAAVLLLAAVLFVGAGAAWPADQVTTVDGLGAKFGTVGTDYCIDGNTITLLRDITLTNPLVVSTGPTLVILDLGGYTLTTHISNGFILYDANVKITNGVFTSSGDSALIRVIGGNTPSSSISTILEIDSNVKMVVPSYYGIMVNSAGASSYLASGPTDIASGVEITVKGELTGGCGLYINGNIQNPGVDESDTPQITIDGAKINCNGDGAIYGAGIGKWTIQNSYIVGKSGLYLRAGTYDISDSEIIGNGMFSVPSGVSNGFDSTGDAILLEAESGYAGDIKVTVKEGSKLQSVNGYALQENTVGQAPSAALLIKLEDTVKLQGGEDGIKTSDALKAKSDRNTIVVVANTVTIYQNNKAETTAYASMGDAQIKPFTPGEKSGEVKVTSTAEIEYSIIIPADVDLTYGVTKPTSVGVSLITKGDSNRMVQVTMSSLEFDSSTTGKKFVLVNGGNKAKYTIYATQEGASRSEVTTNGFVIVSAAANTEGSTTTMELALAEKLPTAGTYSDTLTFTGSVVPVSTT